MKPLTFFCRGRVHDTRKNAMKPHFFRQQKNPDAIEVFRSTNPRLLELVFLGFLDFRFVRFLLGFEL
jgi:hypothetical protein